MFKGHDGSVKRRFGAVAALVGGEVEAAPKNVPAPGCGSTSTFKR